MAPTITPTPATIDEIEWVDVERDRESDQTAGPQSEATRRASSDPILPPSTAAGRGDSGSLARGVFDVEQDSGRMAEVEAAPGSSTGAVGGARAGEAVAEDDEAPESSTRAVGRVRTAGADTDDTHAQPTRARVADAEDHDAPAFSPPATRRARNTAIFSALTGASRVAGLGREIVARSYFGTTGAMSAFTLAFQVPNLIRALVADAALSSAFVPVFSELLVHKKRRQALQLAASLAGLMLIALTVLTLIFIAIAPYLIPLFMGSKATPALDALAVGLSRALFPIVVLLGLTGLVVGILNVHDHFTIPALAPLIWNICIVLGIVGLSPLFEGDDRLYAYAIGVVAGTTVQLLMCLPELIKLGYPLKVALDFRHNPLVGQVLRLMLPVSLGLGLINVSLIVNSTIGFLVSTNAPTAIDAAFRIYMLPQGMFSVAVATVSFPALSRLAARADMAGIRDLLGSGMRQISLLLIPSAAIFIVLAEPICRLIYERGEFDAASTEQTSEALFWFAFSLPVSGVTLMLTRTFFSLRWPAVPTKLALISVVVNIAVSLALYRPLGIGGVVLGTTISNIVLCTLEAYVLSGRIGGLDAARTLRTCTIVLVASMVLGAIVYFLHVRLDGLFGRSLLGQIAAIGIACTGGLAVYAGLLLRLGLPEARQIAGLISRRS